MLLNVEMHVQCFTESELALCRDKEGIGRSGSSCFHPVNYEARQHRPEAGVCPIQIQSHPIYIDLTMLESNYDKSVDCYCSL